MKKRILSALKVVQKTTHRDQENRNLTYVGTASKSDVDFPAQ